MAFYDKFPYTNFQELNLDWITQEVSKVRDNRDASDASAAAALASEQAAAASAQNSAESATEAAGSASAAAASKDASAEYLEQIGTHTAGAVADWLKDNITPTTPAVDASLTISGAAADAKKTGDAVSDLKSQFDGIKDAFNTNKQASEYQWEIGSLNPNYGTPLTSENRIRSEFIKVGVNSLITLSGEANRLIVYGYDASQKYIQGSETTWEDGNIYTVPDGTEYIRILIRKSTSNPKITDVDIPLLVGGCSILLSLPVDIAEYPGNMKTLLNGYSWHVFFFFFF